MGKCCRKYQTAFTLVELLVVIAIIALLLAILMPALAKAREQAAKLICKTHMKELGTAFVLYGSDFRGELPTSPWSTGPSLADEDLPWFAHLAPYFNRNKNKLFNSGGAGYGVYDYELLRCTKQQQWTKWAKSGVKAARGGTALVGWEGIYGYNWFFTETRKTDITHSWRKMNDILQPTDLPILADLSADDPLNAGQQGYAGVRMAFQNPHAQAYKYGWMGGNFRTRRDNYWGPAPNHNGALCNFLMADFHVEERNVCKPNQFPWIGATPQEQQAGNAFHPKRNVAITPR